MAVVPKTADPDRVSVARTYSRSLRRTPYWSKSW